MAQLFMHLAQRIEANIKKKNKFPLISISKFPFQSYDLLGPPFQILQINNEPHVVEFDLTVFIRFFYSYEPNTRVHNIFVLFKPYVLHVCLYHIPKTYWENVPQAKWLRGGRKISNANGDSKSEKIKKNMIVVYLEISLATLKIRRARGIKSTRFALYEGPYFFYYYVFKSWNYQFSL
jgi:hypothetical protein